MTQDIIAQNDEAASSLAPLNQEDGSSDMSASETNSSELRSLPTPAVSTTLVADASPVPVLGPVAIEGVDASLPESTAVVKISGHDLNNARVGMPGWEYGIVHAEVAKIIEAARRVEMWTASEIEALYRKFIVNPPTE